MRKLIIVASFIIGISPAAAQVGCGPYAVPGCTGSGSALVPRSYDPNQNQSGIGPPISPHGGAFGGVCVGPYCGHTDSYVQPRTIGPEVYPHGGAFGGVCVGPMC